MKVKYGQLVACVPVLQKLVQQPIRLRQAYYLSKMASKIDEELIFFRQKYEEIQNSDKNEEEKKRLQDELLNFEVDWPLEVLKFSIDDDLELTAMDITLIEGLIEFTEV